MKQHRKRATVGIRRMGVPTEILRKTEGTTNRFGKTDGGEYAPVDSTYVILSFGHGSRSMNLAGGEMEQLRPTASFPYDAPIQATDQFTVDNVTYEIQQVDPQPTHKTASVVSLNG